jgi:hypothetical protein
VDREAALTQRVAKVAHGREEEHQTLLVLRDVSGLVPRLDHQHRVAVGVEVVEGR